MASVYQQYLKDKNGNIFSPITSAESVLVTNSLEGYSKPVFT